MAVLLVLVGLLAIVATAAVALFTVGAVGAVAAAVVLGAIVVYALFVARGFRALALAITALALVGSTGFAGWTGYQLYAGLTNFSGDVDAPDAAALASAQAKLDEAQAAGGFRVELTEAELTAVLQDTLAGSSDNPIRRVDLAVIDGSGDAPGVLAFDVQFKNGSLTGSGRIAAGLDRGAIELEVQEVSLGRLSLPGLATNAMNEIIETVLDLNERLAEFKADVQALEVGGGRVLVVGTQGTGDLLTASTLLSAIASNAESLANAVAPPEEQTAPGLVNGTSAEGSRYVVALGDSLAANVGVSAPSEGYVSRFHRAVSERDGESYGLRNFGVSGETSGTLLRGGQLDEALAFMRANTVAYVTIDIGANDLLGHLGSADCAEDISDAACQARLNPALQSYRANLERLLAAVREASGGATVVFLTTYNPFSLGFGGSLTLEAASDEATQALNAVAAEVAGRHGVRVADGFTPMRGTAAATTHMLETPPDIHPRASGYDLLTLALVAALP